MFRADSVVNQICKGSFLSLTDTIIVHQKINSVGIQTFLDIFHFSLAFFCLRC
ncbi:hypothetical protein GCWU000342_02207 [Shuttleworthella satelles DSM 14600]|uniref:Uncharacterized protein n=1 Tax=Shuttleworthella satelles DSM 14600 TaxID=626523 RepID=C4GDN3_9FIRM|nr:hypothetical protein GCWU000342_02207 [Shuttleworthia satelles DSM 14600]